MTLTLDALVAEQARARPDRTAIVDADARIAYDALDARANRLARVLTNAGVAPGDRVALLTHKSIDAIASMIAAMRAGLVYVPLDAQSPPARMAKILERCRPRIVVVGPGLIDTAAKLRAEAGVSPDTVFGQVGARSAAALANAAFSEDDIGRAEATPLVSPTRTDDAAHILFTSGSTGVPKGVMVPHRTVLRFVSWANAYFGVRDDDRNSGHSPLHFDLSSYDIYGTLAAGAELHLVPPALNLLPAKLAAFIRERRLTQWFSVPSILSYMARFDAVRPGDFPDLRRVLWCGEVFPTPPLRYWMSRLPSIPFTNLYGPTETTIASSYHTLPSIPASDRDEVPIGAPCEGETLAVVDDAMRPVPDGTIGELVIGGEGLTLGYWEDAETTARAFVEIGEGASRERVYRTGDLARRDPLGAFYFLGRKDSQIKSRGYRIELGEIETALFAIDALADAAVVAVATQGFEGHVICCAYVPREAGLTPVALRTRLAAAIPSYMIPTKWHSFAELPKTSNGKTDRKALRELFAQGDGGDDAR